MCIIHIINIIHTINIKRLQMEYSIATASNNSIAPSGLSAYMFDDFLKFVDITEKSIATYKRALKQFINYLTFKGIKNPTREDVIAFREDLRAEHKATTIQTYIVAIRLFFRWTAQRGLYPDIADHIKGAKLTKEHKKDYLTTKQVKKVLATIDRSTVQGLRDYAIIALMLTGGLRTIEVSRANIEDLRALGDDTVLYLLGKGRQEKAEFVRVVEEVETAIRAYLKACKSVEPNTPLFKCLSNKNSNGRLSTRSISRIVKETLRKAGYDSDRLTAHSLRHTCGTLNLKSGGSLEETQQLLRHSNINTTMVYLHHLERLNNRSEERIAKAIF